MMIGLATLLPSLIVLAVNILGFTAGGVLHGSIAALIQSLVYGGQTAGLFSVLQAFGATAAISPPVVIGIGSILAVVGAALIQSLVYGGQTAGWFSVLQAFGAMAAISPPGIESILAVVGPALIQSLVYGGQTAGWFSVLQRFGATAAISPPVVIGIGSTLAVVGEDLRLVLSRL